jgi:hypothetical protein
MAGPSAQWWEFRFEAAMLGGADDGLSKHNAMSVGCRDMHLSHAPFLVGGRLLDHRAARRDFGMEGVDIIDFDIAEITVVADLLRRERVRAMPEHHAGAVACERFPGDAVTPLRGKAEHVLKVAHVAAEIGHGEDEGVGAKGRHWVS